MIVMIESSGNLVIGVVIIVMIIVVGVLVMKIDDFMGGFNKFIYYLLKYRNMFNSSINEN